MKQLGNTLALIAREKAGIVKPGVPIVCSVTDSEPQTVIAEVAREHGCRLIQLARDFQYAYRTRASGATSDECTEKLARRSAHYGSLDFHYYVYGQEHQIANLSLAMCGRHQAANASVALATIAELRHQGWCISDDAIRLGLSRASLPGRVEVFAGEPTVVLDSAHNPASARALVEALAEMPRPSRRTLVLSISKDKDVPAIVRELAPHFERFVVTQYQENPRAVSAESLADHLHRATSRLTAPTVTIRPIPTDAWKYVSQSTIPGELVSIAGSFFLAAEMRPLVLARQSLLR
jgi:dihydrofolate synthase/folylpolyglutamate synthase